jgi:hypothetical protein
MSGILQTFAYGRAFSIIPANTVAPVVSGTATVGQTLSCTTGTWSGLPSPTFTYQWQRAGSNIGSATSSTYVLVAADAGNAIRCVVTGTNTVGSTSANSNATAAVAATVPGAPTIGTATAVTYSSATVSYTAPASNGGATITLYTATSSPGGITGTLATAGSGTITISGLSASTAYTFTVKATNSVGQSAASGSSNSISTPAAPYCATYTTPGTYTFVPAAGVTSISLYGIGGGGGSRAMQFVNAGFCECTGHCAVCYWSSGGGGGGGSGWAKCRSVTPGGSYSIVVGAGGSAGSTTVGATGGTGGHTLYYYTSGTGPSGSCFYRAGGGEGARGGANTSPGCGGALMTTFASTNGRGMKGAEGGSGNSVNWIGPNYLGGGGGGGAGGYPQPSQSPCGSVRPGPGGAGYGCAGSSYSNPTAGGGGGGGGGGTAYISQPGYGGGGGGGGGILGNSYGSLGGAGGAGNGSGGQGTWGGATGSTGGSSGNGGAGGAYGGGAGGAGKGAGAVGGNGAFRIVWPSPTRSYPGTNTI